MAGSIAWRSSHYFLGLAWLALPGCSTQDLEIRSLEVAESDQRPWPCEDRRDPLDKDLHSLNEVRESLGLEKICTTSLLQGAAAAHARYLEVDTDSSRPEGDLHTEVPGRLGFSGRTPRDRVAAQGSERLDGPVIAEVVLGIRKDGWLRHGLQSVYHRSPLLSPSTRYAGLARVPGPYPKLVLVLGLLPQDCVNNPPLARRSYVVYPAPDRAVSGRFDSDREIPDPLPHLGWVGIPISIHSPICRTPRQPYVAPQPSLAIWQTDKTPRVVASGGPTCQPRQTDFEILTHAQDARVWPSDAYIIPVRPIDPDCHVTLYGIAQHGPAAIQFTTSFQTLLQ